MPLTVAVAVTALDAATRLIPAKAAVVARRPIKPPASVADKGYTNSSNVKLFAPTSNVALDGIDNAVPPLM